MKKFLIGYWVANNLDFCQSSHVFMTLSNSNTLSLFWQFWKQKTWMLSKFFGKKVFITKCDKMTSLNLFGPIWKSLLQSVTKRESSTNFKTIVIKCDKKLLQSVTGITKCDKRLLRSVTGITKSDNYYEVRRNTLLVILLHPM